MEGTAWTVDVTPDAGSRASSFTDTLVFEHGKVSMTECAKSGFRASTYQLSPAGDSWQFMAEQFSVTDGRSLWNAAFRGDRVVGQLRWIKKDGTTINYRIEGAKNAPGPSWDARS